MRDGDVHRVFLDVIERIPDRLDRWTAAAGIAMAGGLGREWKAYLKSFWEREFRLVHESATFRGKHRVIESDVIQEAKDKGYGDEWEVLTSDDSMDFLTDAEVVPSVIQVVFRFLSSMRRLETRYLEAKRELSRRLGIDVPKSWGEDGDGPVESGIGDYITDGSGSLDEFVEREGRGVVFDKAWLEAGFEDEDGRPDYDHDEYQEIDYEVREDFVVGSREWPETLEYIKQREFLVRHGYSGIRYDISRRHHLDDYKCPYLRQKAKTRTLRSVVRQHGVDAVLLMPDLPPSLRQDVIEAGETAKRLDAGRGPRLARLHDAEDRFLKKYDDPEYDIDYDTWTEEDRNSYFNIEDAITRLEEDETDDSSDDDDYLFENIPPPL